MTESPPATPSHAQTCADKSDALRRRVSPETIIRVQEPLARKTTLRVGGPADLYVEPSGTEDLASVVDSALTALHCFDRLRVLNPLVGTASRRVVSA
jgi:hypothetical protein